MVRRGGPISPRSCIHARYHPQPSSTTSYEIRITNPSGAGCYPRRTGVIVSLQADEDGKGRPTSETIRPVAACKLLPHNYLDGDQHDTIPRTLTTPRPRGPRPGSEAAVGPARLACSQTHACIARAASCSHPRQPAEARKGRAGSLGRGQLAWRNLGDSAPASTA